MAVTINVYQRFEATTDAGDLISGGSLTTPVSVSAGSEIFYDQTRSVAATTLTTLWNDDQTADFDFLWIESDTAGQIQLVTSEDVADELGYVIEIAANVPFILAGDLSADLSGGTDMTNIDTWESNWDRTKTIDRIEWYHASGTAIVRTFVAT